jgi:hypothetical protein
VATRPPSTGPHPEQHAADELKGKSSMAGTRQ